MSDLDSNAVVIDDISFNLIDSKLLPVQKNDNLPFHTNVFFL